MDLRKGFHEPVEKPKRFYKAVDVAEGDGGHLVLLDGRRLRTPKALPMVLPTRAVAEQIAGEWASQDQTIEMATMHATRLANTAIETIGGSREAVADQVAQYAGSDLLCYFAEEPAALVARQEAQWGPVLARAEAEAGLRFERCAGIIHRDQPPETLAGVRDAALALDDFALAGLAFGTSLFGSAVLALALHRGWLGGEEAFELSRLDEAFQEEKWGVDSEAAERADRLRVEARMLERWFRNLAG
ncbi:ATP12 family protein [Phenylobacterium sp.]|uniref:ATP12 family chaperone protein n=1 Tax=Phenylobacterium sp. TaxID=1871053 RepID=UPI0025D3D796|nr:ATP12 family protein [Phenylobacterium sp.]